MVNSRAILWWWLGWLLTTAIPADLAAASMRLAVLATEPVQTSGLSDLLAVELSKAGGIELVERAELEKLGTESAVQRMFVTDAVNQRRSAGALLKADLLLLLSRENIQEQECLKVVLADPHNGSRLRVGLLPANAALDETCREIVRIARETIARFPTGAKTIIGVSPFLSRALVHDYDYLQSSLGYLLETALSAAPGVAVIEMEEAEALRQEANVAGSGQVSRVVPLLVRGEFTVQPGPGRPEFSLKIEVSDGARVWPTMAPAAPVPLPGVVAYLGRELPTQILALVRPGLAHPFSPEAEFGSLVARAEEFARAGANLYSTGLREAAVLLQDSEAQRKLLIREYCALMRSSTHRVYHDAPGKPRDEKMVREAKDRALSEWRLACSHLDFLTMNRKIDAREYTELADRILANENVITGEAGPQADAFKMERKRHLLAMLPHAFDLPFAEGDRAHPHYVQQRLLYVTLHNLMGRRKADLETLAEIIERIPDGMPPSSELTYFFAQPPDRSAPPDYPEEAWVEFLTRVQRSPHALDRIFARYGLLYRQHLLERKNSGPALLADIESLMAEFGAWADAQKIPGSFREPLQMKLSDLRTYIKRDLEPTPADREPFQPRPPQPLPSTGRLQITEIALQLKTLAGKTTPLSGPWQVSQCNDHLDVFWSKGAILFHRTRGLLEEVLLDGTAFFDDVARDGTGLWIGTRRSGVWRLDAEGRVTLKVGSDLGLPPADKGIRLYVVAPGKVCAIGSFGEHERAWCAMIETQPKPAVKVFHTATRVLTDADDRKADSTKDPDMVFTPAWVHLYEDAEGQHNRLWVGRYGQTHPCRKTPLEIDLETLQVRLAPITLTDADMRSSAAYYSSKGTLLEAGDFDVAQIAPAGTTFADGKKRRAICVPRNKEGTANGGLGKILLPRDGFVYVPGVMWFRIDPQTMQTEQLTPDRLPSPGSDFHHFAVSAHYGLMGWSYRGDKFYQITIDEAGAAKPTSAQ
ncbi:MAG: hypothetical protein QOE70_3358 [Chthoniobacter sp.]|jgi:hypothetical protein|nr:hypothetical protein [Chthoniobacter sp.]